jgi:uncharacterized protein (TIGR02594 family)
MFYLKTTAFAGVLIFAMSMIGTAAEAATIKKRAGSLYSCTIYQHYERCVKIKKKKKPKVVRTKVKIQIPQAEWPITYDTAHIHSVAARFVGLHERVNRDMLQSIIKIDPARTAWCGAFVNAMLDQTGYTRSDSNQARSFLRYGVATREPKKGDIVVLRSHVGFFDGYTYRNGRKYVMVLGGNQSNRVQTSTFLASQVITYRKVA